jgi:hypothetical protein
MKPGSRTSRKRFEAKIALWSIFGDFLADRCVMKPRWYHLISTRNKHIPGTEKPSHIPALSQVFGMNDMLSDELLLACGLLHYHGNQLRFREEQWELLQGEFQLYDAEVSRVGSKEKVIRLGALWLMMISLMQGKRAVRTKDETLANHIPTE